MCCPTCGYTFVASFRGKRDKVLCERCWTWVGRPSIGMEWEGNDDAQRYSLRGSSSYVFRAWSKSRVPSIFSSL